jgi:hypothetical protein
MHPEIEKFWVRLGYSIIIDILEDDLWKFYYVLMKNGIEVGFAGVSDPQSPGTKNAFCTIYFMDGQHHSEQEMLRIIKLKAFL